MPFLWSGVASAPDGAAWTSNQSCHRNNERAVSGSPFFVGRPCPLSGPASPARQTGRHGLLTSPVTGIMKGRSSDRLFRWPPMPLEWSSVASAPDGAAWTSNQSCHRNNERAVFGWALFPGRRKRGASVKLDARLSRTSVLSREIPRKINRLHNFEGPRGRAQILSRFGTAPHLSRPFLRLMQYCGGAAANQHHHGPDIGTK
jgi:hypothetical protein